MKQKTKSKPKTKSQAKKKLKSKQETSDKFYQYEKKIYDLMQLIEIFKGLNSTLIDYNKLIDSILLACMGQMQLVKAGIFLKKEIDKNIFVLHRNYKGFDPDHSTEFEIQGESGFIEFLDKEYRCYEIDELTKVFSNDTDFDVIRKLSPDIIMPLRGKDKLNGIIVLGERIKNEPFSDEEKQYLMYIASIAGVAIHNAYLYEMATTDMMTRLKLHHFFQASLIEERNKSIRNKTQLSLIMLDIDHFKDLNDMYGHVCGDMVLKNVGKTILENIRRIDIAARYGGEEFAIILPKTGIEEAYIISERIRKSLEELKVEYNNKSVSITVSSGITQFFPLTDVDNQSFIDRTDKALYLSKKEGRNRTTAYMNPFTNVGKI
jgi:two-component system, cell cycle response regulator